MPVPTLNPTLESRPTNLEDWKRDYILHAKATFGNPGSYIEAGKAPDNINVPFLETLSQEEKTAIDKAKKLEFEAHKVKMQHHEQRREAYLNSQSKIFADMMMTLSRASQNLVKQDNAEFSKLSAENDYLGLWTRIIKVHTHEGRVASLEDKKAKIKELNEIKQGNRTLSEHNTSFQACVDQCLLMKCSITDEDLVSTYILSLNPEVFGLRVKEMARDHAKGKENAYPKSLEEAKTEMAEWLTVGRNVDKLMTPMPNVSNMPHEGLAHAVQASSGAHDQSVKCIICLNTHKGGAQRCSYLKQYLDDHPDAAKNIVNEAKLKIKAPGRGRKRPRSDHRHKATRQEDSDKKKPPYKAKFKRTGNEKQASAYHAALEEWSMSHPDQPVGLVALKITVNTSVSSNNALMKYVHDSGANVNLFGNKALLTNIKACAPTHIKGVGKRVANTWGMSIFGPALYLPDFPINIVAHNLCTAKYRVTSDSMVEHTFTVNGTAKFVRGEHGLHWMDHADALQLMASTMVMFGTDTIPQHVHDPSEAPTKFYNSEQKRRAAEVMKLHYSLGHPSDGVLIKLLDNNVIINCPHTARDVKIMRNIYGQCTGCIKGKAKNPPQLLSVALPPDRPGTKLHVDFFFIKCISESGKPKRIPYLLSTDDFDNYLLSYRLDNRKQETVETALRKMVNHYRAFDYKVEIILSDRESVLRSCETFINGKLQAELEITSTGQHVVRAERYICVIKERFRTIVYSLPYKLPQFLFPALVRECIADINLCPNARTMNKSPRELVTGRKLMYHPNLLLPFGAICEFKIPRVPNSTNDDDERTETGIVVGHNHDNHSVEVYVFNRAAFVNRKTVVRVKLSVDHIALIEKLNTVPMDPILDDVLTLDKESRNNADHSPSSPYESRTPPPADTSTLPTSKRLRSEESEFVIPNTSVTPQAVEASTESIMDASDNPAEKETASGTTSQSSIGRSEERNDVTQPNTTTTSSAVKEISIACQPDPLRSTSRRSRRTPLDYAKLHKRGIANLSDAGDKYNICMVTYVDETGISQLHVMPAEVAAFSAQSSQECCDKYPQESHRAMKKEAKQLCDLHVLEPVLRPDPSRHHKRILTTAIEIKAVFDPRTGSLLKVKGRILTHGNQVDISAYAATDKSSPTVRIESLFLIINIGTIQGRIFFTMDIPGAYLHAILLIPHTVRIKPHLAAIFIECRPEWKKFLQADGSLLAELKKALYGLPESSKLWFSELRNTLLELQYVQCISEPCIFRKSRNSSECTLCIHVDDIFGSSQSEELITELQTTLRRKYGDPRMHRDAVLPYLGMCISQPRDGECLITMPQYVEKLLEKFSITKFSSSPATADLFTIDANSTPIDRTQFLSALMSVMYLATRIRPDMLLPLSYLATRGSAPTVQMQQHLTRVLHYLNATKNYYLRFTPTDYKLYAWIDASYNVHSDSKGHSGISITLGRQNAPVYCRSTKQKLVTRSSTEAELVAMDSAMVPIMDLGQLLQFFGCAQEPTIIFQDNMSSIWFAQHNITRSGKMRHLVNRFHYITQQVQLGKITLVHCNTINMIVDILTKPKSGRDYNRLRDLLLNVSENVAAIAVLLNMLERCSDW